MNDSVVTVIFDANNPNWQRDHEYNLVFLKASEGGLNERLRRQGHLLLNDVFDVLGMERTFEGANNGWVSGDTISFGIDEDTISPESIELNLNDTGFVWEKIHVSRAQNEAEHAESPNEEDQELTVLVAFTVLGKNPVYAQRALLEFLPGVEESQDTVTSYWIAEDDAIDGNDCDSAIFVPRGSQRDMGQVISNHMDYKDDEWQEEGYPYAKTDVSGTWFESREHNRNEGIRSNIMNAEALTCRDAWTGQYFTVSAMTMGNLVTHMNALLDDKGYARLSDMQEYLRMDVTSTARGFGWTQDVQFSATFEPAHRPEVGAHVELIVHPRPEGFGPRYKVEPLIDTAGTLSDLARRSSDRLTREEAQVIFAPYLRGDCTADGCWTAAGELCDTPSVWVHHERFVS